MHQETSELISNLLDIIAKEETNVLLFISLIDLLD